MKKIVFLVLLVFLLSICSLGNIFASSKSQMIQSSTKYFETSFTSQGADKREISAIEAQNKIQFKENLKKLDKKIKSNEYVSDLDDFSVSVISAVIVIDDGGGGGSGNTSLIVYPQVGTENTTTVNCTLSTYSYCRGIAETMGTITKLVTSVSMNPNSKLGAHIKNELTWYDSPNNSFTDYMAVGYDGIYLDPVFESITAKTQVFYTSYGYDDVQKLYPTSRYYTDTRYYSGDNKNIDFTINGAGVVWNIVDVYTSYSRESAVTHDPLLYDNNGNMYWIVDVTRVIYTLETDLALKVLNAYKDLNTTMFWGDYRHTYFCINFVFNGLTLNGYIIGTNPFISYLSISITPTIMADGSRKNDIQFFF